MTPEIEVTKGELSMAKLDVSNVRGMKFVEECTMKAEGLGWFGLVTVEGIRYGVTISGAQDKEPYVAVNTLELTKDEDARYGLGIIHPITGFAVFIRKGLFKIKRPVFTQMNKNGIIGGEQRSFDDLGLELKFYQVYLYLVNTPFMEGQINIKKDADKRDTSENDYEVHQDAKGSYARVARCFSAGDAIVNHKYNRVMVTESSIGNINDLIPRMERDTSKTFVAYSVTGGIMIEEVPSDGSQKCVSFKQGFSLVIK
jgi:hypothetical protein